VTVTESRTYSKSRKVNTLVKLTIKRAFFEKKAKILNDEIWVRYGNLTGGQIAEYNRIMGVVIQGTPNEIL